MIGEQAMFKLPEQFRPLLACKRSEEFKDKPVVDRVWDCKKP